MDIEVTYNGQKLIIKNVSIGGLIKWEYIMSDGSKKTYYIHITDKEKSVMN